MAGLIPAIVLLVIGWVGRGYYDGYYTAKAENEVYLEWVKEFKKVSDFYAPQLQALPNSDLDTGPAVTDSIDRVPKPGTKPRNRQDILPAPGKAK
jgi:hypothetical protein